MKIVELQSVPNRIVRWRDTEARATLVLKLTFRIDDDGSVSLARKQRPLVDTQSTPSEAPDIVPGKTWADLLVVGQAKSEVPRRVVPVRFSVEPIERVVFAHASEPLQRLPLGSSLRRLSDPSSPPVFVGPGPAPAFTDGDEVASFDAFNVAPSEQRLSSITPGGALELDGLVGSGSTWRARVPRERPFAVLQLAEDEWTRLELRCDTLLIDADAAILTMTWRGRLPGVGDAHTLVVGIERADAPLSTREIARRRERHAMRRRERARATTQELDGKWARGPGEVWPFQRESSSPPPPLALEPDLNAGDTAPSLDDVTMPAPPMPAPPSTQPGSPRPWAPPRQPPSAPLPIRAPNPLAEQGYGCGPTPSLAPEATPGDEEEMPPTTDSTPPSEERGPRSEADVSLELCASLSAALDMYPDTGDRAALLEEERLSEDVWRRAQHRWRERIAEGVHLADTSLLTEFDRAYVQRLERERGPLDVESIALLELAIERGDVADAVVRLGVPQPAVIRIKRVWTRKLMRDAELREELRTEIRRSRS